MGSSLHESALFSPYPPRVIERTQTLQHAPGAVKPQAGALSADLSMMTRSPAKQFGPVSADRAEQETSEFTARRPNSTEGADVVPTIATPTDTTQANLSIKDEAR